MAISQHARDLASDLNKAINEVLTKYNMQNVRANRFTEYPNSGRFHMHVDAYPTNTVIQKKQNALGQLGLVEGTQFVRHGSTFVIKGTKDARRNSNTPEGLWVVVEVYLTGKLYRMAPREVKKLING